MWTIKCFSLVGHSHGAFGIIATCRGVYYCAIPLVVHRLCNVMAETWHLSWHCHGPAVALPRPYHDTSWQCHGPAVKLPWPCLMPSCRGLVKCAIFCSLAQTSSGCQPDHFGCQPRVAQLQERDSVDSAAGAWLVWGSCRSATLSCQSTWGGSTELQRWFSGQAATRVQNKTKQNNWSIWSVSTHMSTTTIHVMSIHRHMHPCILEIKRFLVHVVLHCFGRLG